MFVKVVGSSAVDPDLVRQKSVVEQEITNSAIFLFFKKLKILIED